MKKGDPGEKGEQGEAGVVDYTGLATTTYVDTGLELKADKTYVDSKVQTDVPANALFTDTIVDISGKADKTQVLTNVPANAKFTDTTYGVATTSSSGLMSGTDKQNLDANTTSRHTHTNKSVIDKFTEVDNKPYYNGEEIGGAVPNLTLNELILGGRYKMVYNDIEDSLDIEVI